MISEIMRNGIGWLQKQALFRKGDILTDADFPLTVEDIDGESLNPGIVTMYVNGEPSWRYQEKLNQQHLSGFCSRGGIA